MTQPQETLLSGEYTYRLLEDGTAEIINCSPAWLPVDPEIEVPEALDGHAVTAIGYRAFFCCERTTEISLPDSVTTLAGNPFVGCSSLQSIRVSQQHPVLAVVDGALFDKVKKRLLCVPEGLELEKYAVPQGTLSIGEEALWGCKHLKEFTLPEGLRSIGKWALGWMPDLPQIALPNSVTTLVGNPFAGCKSLRLIQVSKQHPTLTVADGALFDKVSRKLICVPQSLELRRYAVPKSVQAIGDSAFAGCDSLTKVILPDSVTTLEANPFAHSRYLRHIRVSWRHPTLAVTDGVLFDKVRKALLCAPRGLRLYQYTVPQGTLSIGENAFSWRSFLEEITLTEGLESIGNEAFTGCSHLDEVALPESLRSIGSRAFAECFCLSKVTLTEGLRTIGNEAFAECPFLGEVALPESLRSIGDEAFAECSRLSRVTLPFGAERFEVGYCAFANCSQDLTLLAARGSYAETWAKESGMQYALMDPQNPPFDPQHGETAAPFLITPSSFSAAYAREPARRPCGDPDENARFPR